MLERLLTGQIFTSFLGNLENDWCWIEKEGEKAHEKKNKCCNDCIKEENPDFLLPQSSVFAYMHIKKKFHTHIELVMLCAESHIITQACPLEACFAATESVCVHERECQPCFTIASLWRLFSIAWGDLPSGLFLWMVTGNGCVHVCACENVRKMKEWKEWMSK